MSTKQYHDNMSSSSSSSSLLETCIQQLNQVETEELRPALLRALTKVVDLPDTVSASAFNTTTSPSSHQQMVQHLAQQLCTSVLEEAMGLKSGSDLPSHATNGFAYSAFSTATTAQLQVAVVPARHASVCPQRCMDVVRFPAIADLVLQYASADSFY
jgi:hypothetical protein